MLTPAEAFKVGFLARCVEDRLTPEQIKTSAEKAAALMTKGASITGLLSAALGKTMELGGGAAKTMFSYGVPAALAAPPIIGGIAGYGLARATDIDDTDVSEIKDREVIDELRRQTEKLQRQQANRAAPAKSTTSRPLL